MSKPKTDRTPFRDLAIGDRFLFIGGDPTVYTKLSAGHIQADNETQTHKIHFPAYCHVWSLPEEND